MSIEAVNISIYEAIARLDNGDRTETIVVGAGVQHYWQDSG